MSMVATETPKKVVVRSVAPRLNRNLHYLLLAILLFALAPVAGQQSVWSADEGALLYQSAALGSGEGWAFDHPFPEADPDGTYFPLHLSVVTENGQYLVLAKHIGFLWIVVGAFQLGGYGGVIALSIISTLLAAVGASRLAGAIESSFAIPALWLTGAASPLLINSYVAWGHTVAAACAVLGAHSLIRSAQTRRGGANLILGAIFIGLACLVRTEATLLGGALAVGLAVATVVDRAGLWGWARAACGAFAGTTTGFFVDRLTAVPYARVTDPDADIDPWGGLAGRFEGFINTWIQPSHQNPETYDVLILIAAVAILAVGVLARRGQASAGPTRAALLVAVAAIVLRFLASPSALIPGLLLAFPVLFAGLMLLKKRDLKNPAVLALGSTFVVYCLAVLATQYRYGGGGEWGGRYFALGLPLAIAAIGPAVTRTARDFPAPARRQIAILMAASIFITMSMGIIGMREARIRTDSFTSQVDAALVPAGDEAGSPVVVTTIEPLARWSWDTVDNGRWLLVPPEDIPTVAARLHSLGVEQFVLVVRTPDEQLPQIDPWFEPVPNDSPTTGTGSELIVQLKARS